MKARRTKGLLESGGKTRGRRCLDCPYSRNKQRTKEPYMRSSLSENTNASEKQSNSKETEEVPIELRDLMQLACLVKRVPGDGACLFTSGCLWIKGSKEKNKLGLSWAKLSTKLAS